MAAVAVGVALQERGAASGPGALHKPGRDFVNGAHVLTIDPSGFDAESSGAPKNGSRGRFLVMRVLVVLIVFADVDHWQLPQLRQVHYFVERSLAERAFSKEADGNAIGAQSLGGESCASGDTNAAADDRVGAEVAGSGISDVHRSTLAATIARFFSQQLGEHAVGRCTLGQAVSVAAVRAGDVIVNAQSFANAHGNGFFAAVQMGKSGHECASVNLVHLFFKQTDAHHLAIGVKPLLLLGSGFAASCGVGSNGCHFFLGPAVTGVVTPDIAASTSNMQAKSYFVQPMPRAAVRISLLTAVEGSGTSSWRPRSIARTISFCIMLMSNQASSGCRSTKGPRY